MAALEICMIIIGVIFIIGSFLISEKLSSKELEELSGLTKEEMERMVASQLNSAEEKIREKIDEEIELSVERVQRSMEKESNDKIMSISEYSDTVLENINKNHTEVMFLYSMLTDKEEELKHSVSEAQVLSSQLESNVYATKEDMPSQDEEEAASAIRPFLLERADESVYDESMETALENNNKIILEKHRAGCSVVQIAKQLGLGQGEVKLVIDLYEGTKA